MRFEDYITELLGREEQAILASKLIGAWSDPAKTLVGQILKESVDNYLRPQAEMTIEGWHDATSQSKGNRVAKYVLEHLLQHPKIARKAGTGNGYPDYWLDIGGTVYAIEMKATGNLNPSSTNRTVLLSSSKTLRKALNKQVVIAPIRHAILQIVFHNRKNQHAVFKSANLYFLEPDTEVNVRFEASTHQKGLRRVDSLTL